MKKLKEIPFIGELVLQSPEIWGDKTGEEEVAIIAVLDEDNRMGFMKPENVEQIKGDEYFMRPTYISGVFTYPFWKASKPGQIEDLVIKDWDIIFESDLV